MLHSDVQRYQEVERLLAAGEQLPPTTRRALQVARLAFKGNQLPPATLRALSEAQAEILRAFNTFRAELGGKQLTNNDLLEILAKERDAKRRRAAWEASKLVGAQVAAKLVALTKLRNQAARQLGFASFWEMRVRLQEHDPQQLLALFAELEKLTDAPYAAMKLKLDAEVGRRLRVKPAALMPWHYPNPFFQDAPPNERIDLDAFFKGKPREEIVAIAGRFYREIGLDIAPIAARSDLYEREGKDQHAFCTSIDRGDDVRTLLNVKPTASWMETMLHEMGHALYSVGVDRTLPFNLRDSAHAFTTEGVAMLFGALAKNPLWLKEYAGADAKLVDRFGKEILEQRRREQLIFVRWGMVMLHFEKALSDDPDQDLNALWWRLVERFQRLRRPDGALRPDWAAKPHFTIAPVYYHNYVLGELFAAQLRAQLAKLAGHTGPTSSLSFNGQKRFGDYLVQRVFRPGMREAWPAFVVSATGQPLAAEAYAAELR
jgi:peptidyl-dipeptidase A